MKNDSATKEPSTVGLVPRPKMMVERVLADGIPVFEAIFHTAVNSIEKSPEERFTDGSSHKSRNVQMIWTEIGLWCTQKGQAFLVPASNVKSVYFK